MMRDHRVAAQAASKHELGRTDVNRYHDFLDVLSPDVDGAICRLLFPPCQLEPDFHYLFSVD
jgi:hypothetical protein